MTTMTNHQKASLKLAIKALESARQKIAPDANGFKLLHIDSPYMRRAAKEHDRLTAAIADLWEMIAEGESIACVLCTKPGAHRILFPDGLKGLPVCDSCINKFDIVCECHGAGPILKELKEGES